jgi:hypothetical protein
MVLDALASVSIRVVRWLFARDPAPPAVLPGETPVWFAPLGVAAPVAGDETHPFPTGWVEIGRTTGEAFSYDVAAAVDPAGTVFDPADLTREVTMTYPLSPEEADRLAVWFESLHDCKPPIAVGGSFHGLNGGDLNQTIRRGGTRTTWTCPFCRVDWLLTGTGAHWYRPSPLTFRKATG